LTLILSYIGKPSRLRRQALK